MEKGRRNTESDVRYPFSILSFFHPGEARGHPVFPGLSLCVPELDEGPQPYYCLLEGEQQRQMEVTVRQGTIADERRVVQLIREADRVDLRFRLRDLKTCLCARPFLLAYARRQLLGFMFWDLSCPALA